MARQALLGLLAEAVEYTKEASRMDQNDPARLPALGAAVATQNLILAEIVGYMVRRGGAK